MEHADIEKIAEELAGRPVRITWADNWIIRKARGLYHPLLRRIWISVAFRGAPENVVRALIAHELGHANDRWLHRSVWGIFAAPIGLWLASTGIPLPEWIGLALYGLGVLSFFLLVAMPWEKRADRWAEHRVGRMDYWAEKLRMAEIAASVPRRPV